MIIGFTGTRNQPTNAQIGWLYEIFALAKDIECVHHGACVGADTLAHRAALESNIPIVVHPPTNERLMERECLAPHKLVKVVEPKPYLVRNRDIVGETTGLIALPSEPEGEHGGTWYTVHFAQRMNKPVVICWPHGEVEQRQAKGEDVNGGFAVL